MLSFLRELFTFMRMRKKFWLVPVVVLMLVFGALMLLAQTSALAPFIYTLY
jgi:hypothetical protein